MKEIIKELLPMKWYFVYAAALLGWLAYANLTGDRILSFDNQEQWSSGNGGSRAYRSGVIHHK